MVKYIASITSAAGLSHGSDVLLLENLISCFAEKLLQFDLSPQLFVMFWSFFFFTLMNPSLTKCYSQHGSHVTDSVIWMVVFFAGAKTLSVSALRFPSAPQDRPRARSDASEGCSWCSVLPTRRTALELVVCCMDGVRSVIRVSV